jgi:hypothetical protein
MVDSKRQVRALSDWIGIVETAYSLDGDFEPWLEHV